NSLMLFILFTRRHVIFVSTWSRVYNSTLLSVSRTAHKHTDTCAHTQVMSTLPPADRIGLKNQCTATDTFKLLKTNIQAFMNPAEIFSSLGSTMRPNENGYNRRGNRTYVQNVRTENSEIDLASIFYLFPRVVRGPFYIESGNKSMKCNGNYLFSCE